MQEIIDRYLNQSDWRIKENANIGFSHSALIWRIACSAMEEYMLKSVYPDEISKAHIEGWIHIHNLYMGLAPYCCGWSTLEILKTGMRGAVYSKPPKHLDTACLILANTLGALQNEWSGAQALNSVDTLLAPYVRKDGLSYRQVRQIIQQFIYNLNITSRWGGQTPFTNVTLDLTLPEDLKNTPVTFDSDKCYGDFEEEIKMIDKAFIDVMTEGDGEGKPFTFPVLTFNVDKDFFENELLKQIGALTVKYGIPYFSNFISSDMSKSDIRSMCCRLRLDMRELKKNITGGLFGSSDKTGSIGVVTINLPRIGYLAKDDDEFFDMLDHYLDIARCSLEIKRVLVESGLKKGLFVHTSQFLEDFKNYFSTIGILGMHECCLNYLGTGIDSPEGLEFAEKVLRHVRDMVKGFQIETGNLYNFEAVPAESTSYRLALLDKQKYPDIKTSGEKEPYYTSSSWLPVNHTMDFWSAVRHQERLQTLYTGGTVFHIFGSILIKHEGLNIPIDISQKVLTASGSMDLIKEIFTKSRLPYVTITPSFSVCSQHGYLGPSDFKTCPYCGKETLIYSRVVGYIRPVKDWNAGKQEEFRQRRSLVKVRLEV